MKFGYYHPEISVLVHVFKHFGTMMPNNISFMVVRTAYSKNWSHYFQRRRKGACRRCGLESTNLHTILRPHIRQHTMHTN